jgi:pimeloyl-ACP methyl ester carboxylesterase
MTPHADGHGLRLRAAAGGPGSAQPPRVLLIHGLDEPGLIWDDLVPALAAAGIEVWELRYPNDQAISSSAAYLAGRWSELPAAPGVILIGHSMGGLVARELVSAWRHPVDRPPRVAGAPVAGVIMVGTPNHGSPWARLRVWLELREQFEDARQRRFSLFAGLRDGLGQAKVDLRPDSAFLLALNARPWPPAVPRAIIGARLLGPADDWLAGLDAAAAEVQSEELRRRLHAWWKKLGNRIGDGAVPAASLELAGAPEPVLVDATHRTMLRRLHAGGPPPPAIDLIVAQVREWTAP